MNFNQFRMTNSSIKRMEDVEVYIMSILLNEKCTQELVYI